MKIALLDPSLFTAPYDRALMQGIQQEEPGSILRLFTRALQPGEARDERFVEHFYRNPYSLGTGRLAKGAAHPLYMASLCRALAAWRPDVIHIQLSVLPLIDLWFLPRLRRIAPLVLTVHDSNPFNGDPRSRLQALGSRAVLRQADALVVHTEQARRRLEACGIAPGRIVRIPHGLLHDLPAVPPCGPVRRKAAGAPLNFILFGKLKPYKGADILIHAVARLPEELRALCQVRIVGRPYMDTAPLESLVRRLGVMDRVAFEFGHLPDEAIGELFSDNAVAVFPYREIDSSGVLMTAIAAGCPIVASRLGGFAELLEEGHSALLFTPGDDSALACALSEILTAPELREKLAGGVRRLRDATPDWPSIGRRTAALYHALVAARVSGQQTASFALPHPNN